MCASTEDPLAATPILPTRQPQFIPLGFHANLFQYFESISINPAETDNASPFK